MPQKVIVITGPTATGKTTLGAMLAREIGGEVISADSMQIYKDMDIGTAKPKEAEMLGIPHHLLDVVSPFEDYSVARYVEDAVKCIDDILSRGLHPIIVGGTGLYIESLISGRDFADGHYNSELRADLSAQYDELGGDNMLLKLREFDPDSSRKLHSNDKKRIIRAFEVFLSGGKTISQHNLESQLVPCRYDACKIALSFESRADLYRRIDRRVDIMLGQGLEAEVQSLLDMGLTAKHTSMQAIGYKEMAQALSGECSISDAAEKIKLESRRYAKRQLSWLRRDTSIHWIFWDNEPDYDMGLHRSTQFLAQNGYNIAASR